MLIESSEAQYRQTTIVCVLWKKTERKLDGAHSSVRLGPHEQTTLTSGLGKEHIGEPHDNSKQCHEVKCSFADDIIISGPILKIQDGVQTQ